MAKFDISKNQLYATGGKAIAKALMGNQVITELNIAGNDLTNTRPWTSGDMSGVIAISNAIPTMGAISSVNILSNKIGAEQANELIKIMSAKPNLKTLCGFNGDEMELDLRNKGLTAGCAVLVANEVKDNGAMKSLDISDNWLEAEGAKHIAAALPGCK